MNKNESADACTEQVYGWSKHPNHDAYERRYRDLVARVVYRRHHAVLYEWMVLRLKRPAKPFEELLDHFNDYEVIDNHDVAGLADLDDDLVEQAKAKADLVMEEAIRERYG